MFSIPVLAPTYSNINSDEYSYLLSICGNGIEEECGSVITNRSEIAACQRGNDHSYVIGQTTQQILR